MHIINYLQYMTFAKNSNVKFYYNNAIDSYSETGQCNQELNSTSRTSYASYSGQSMRPSSNSGNYKRTNQLRPTKNIRINQQNWQQKLKANHRFEQQQMMKTSMNYKSIKPTIGLGKYMVLCGMEKGEGIQGCQCFRQPCKYSLQWTTNYSPKHKYLYSNLHNKKLLSPAMAEQIQKDLPRTYPDCPTFSLNHSFREKLRNILKTYSVYDLQTAYVQGMNMVAAVLLYHIRKQEETFWALVDLMDEQELRMVYSSGFESLKKHAAHIIRLIELKIFDLFKLMRQLDVTPQAFLYGWILSLMSNCVPLEFMHLVIDKFRIQGWTFIYKFIITYLLFLKQALMMSTDSSEFLVQLNNSSSRQVGIHWQEMIQNCHKVQL